MIRFKQTIPDNQMIVNIPWYYGKSYRKFDMRVDVFHIIPFNFLIRMWRNIVYFWNRLRFSQPYSDQILDKTFNDAFMQGYNTCEKTLDRRLQILQEHLQKSS